VLEIDISKSDTPNIQILTLSGEFDLFEKEKVMSLLPRMLSNDVEGLIIDLTNISLLASAGVEVLIRFHSELSKAGKRMALVVDHNNYLIRKFRNLGIFEGTGLEFFETVEEAEKALS